jgi:transposase, IS5 family
LRSLQARYKQVKNLGDRLGELATLIEWEPFREIVGDLYTNTTEQGRRPNIDVVLRIKLLVLQSMYGLSDPELERQANDKISFLRFLGFPEKIPDQTTVWYFQERLSKTNQDEAIWSELQRQLDGKGLMIRKGVIHDATYFGLIRALQTTTASFPDSQIDLSEKGEVVYRDRGYFGTEPNGF